MDKITVTLDCNDTAQTFYLTQTAETENNRNKNSIELSSILSGFLVILLFYI